MALAALVCAIVAIVVAIFALAVALDARDFWRELVDDFRAFQRRQGLHVVGRAAGSTERPHVQ